MSLNYASFLSLQFFELIFDFDIQITNIDPKI